MKKIAGLLTVVVSLFVGIVGVGVAGSVSRYLDARTAQQAQLHALALQQQAFELEQARAQAAATAPASILFTYALYLLAVGAFGLLLWGCYDAYNARARAVIKAKNGTLSLSPQALLSMTTEQQLALYAATYAGQVQVQIEQAKASIAAPHILHQHPAPVGALQAPTALLQPQGSGSNAPAFSSLLGQGAFRQPNRILLGYAEGQPLYGTWRDLYGTAVAGLPGSGKTTTVRFLAAQSALQGARFAILDPHKDAGEDSLAGTLAPLSSAFLYEPASEETDMLLVVEEIARRLEARLKGDADRSPIILAADEFTRLMSRGELAGPLAKLLEGLAQEGRKVGMYALLSGQIWTAARAGGTGLRDSLASSYVHRVKANQARMLLPAEEARRAEQLQPGECILYRTTGELIKLSIPNTTGADMERVAGLLPPPATGATIPLITTTPTAAESPVEPLYEAAEVVEPVVAVVSPEPTEEERILAAASEYPSRTALCEALYGCSGGAPYRKVQQVLDGAGLLMPRKRERAA